MSMLIFPPKLEVQTILKSGFKFPNINFESLLELNF